MSRFLPRALAAVGLWLGFYVLGLAVAGLLFALPWAQWTYEKTLGISGILAGAGGAWVLWAIFPRGEGKREKGKPVPPERHAPLHALVAETARALGRRPPAELHLFLESNAFVASDRRWLGLSSRTIVGIGLPFLGWLDRDALRSVVAHELGHEHGGDTALGPWIRRTRLAIGRALDHLDGSSFWLHLPFVGYARLFLGVTAEASRRQELHADAVAAGLCGVPATARALVRIHDLADLWSAYLSVEIMPLLERGIAVPMLAGFTAFLEAAGEPGTPAHRIRGSLARPPRPHDTHPTLEARLAALGAAPVDATVPTQALDLLDGVVVAETDVLATMVRDLAKLHFLEWPEVGREGWLAIWQRELGGLGDALNGLTPSRLPAVFANVTEWTARVRRGLAVLSPEAERRRLVALLGSWLAVTLHGAGFAIDALPGRQVLARLDGYTMPPLVAVEDLAEGRITRGTWEATCRELGLP